jgi:radical SAM protein with 4Fe4S-binding SPASM domain
MNCLPPNHTERRGDRTLLVWGDIPFWTVVDQPAADFIEALGAGLSPDAALEEASTGRTGLRLHRDAAAVITVLKRAGVIGGRRHGPPPERIESISVNVTSRCNLSCRFCYNSAHARAGPEVSADEMIVALESVRRHTARGAAFALLGGEPLLEKEKTLALARWGRKRRLRPILSTNGLLVDCDFATAAAETGLECQVSIDGARAESHDDIRGSGTFDQAVRGVKTFVEAGAHTIVSMVFHAGNVAEIPDFLHMADELGAQEARFIPIKHVGGGGEYQLPSLVEVIMQVTDALAAEPKLGKLLGRDYVSILAQQCQTCSPRQTCGTGSQTFLLDADGTVYPCINLASSEMAAGSITREPLAQIWQDSALLRRIREQVRIDVREGSCAQCVVRHWCMGGCRGETYAATGRLDRPSVACREHRAAVLEMFWTLADHPELLRAGPRYC